MVFKFKFAKNNHEVEEKYGEGQKRIADKEYAPNYGTDKNFEKITAVFVANNEE